MQLAAAWTRWGLNLRRGGRGTSSRRKVVATNEKHEAVGGLIRSSLPHRGNQILPLTFPIKGRLLYGRNDRLPPQNLRAPSELEHRGQSRSRTLFTELARTQNRSRGTRRVMFGIHADRPHVDPRCWHRFRATAGAH